MESEEINIWRCHNAKVAPRWARDNKMNNSERVKMCGE
jgi:hypothetical protein